MGMQARLRDGDRYELIGELASGGMATVYLARMRRPLGFSRLVAVKCMHPQMAKDPSFSAMFVDEARLTARLRHPNIVPTLDIVAEDGHLLLVMEYVEGEALSSLLRAVRAKDERLPASVACAIVHDVLLGLHEAHEAVDDDGTPLGIVHRDVSPQNVIVGVDGLSRVLDFGIAKARQNLHHTADREVKGKLPYMPPEQLYGERLDRRVDVFAAGVLLWESLVGARLFDAPNETLIVKRLTEDAVPSPRSRVPEIDPELDAIVMKALSRDANERFATALEMAERIEAVAKLATRTEVSSWVKRHSQPRIATPVPAEVEATTTIVAVLEGSSPRPAVERPRRAAGKIALAASVAAIVSIAGVAVAKATKAEPRGVVALATHRAPAKNVVKEASAPPPMIAPPPPPRVGAPAPKPAPIVTTAAPPLAASITDNSASCKPPYVVDALGHRHYRVECL
jgi:serine/threonine-protein kinase